MKISLEQVGKRYKFEWIFRNLDFDFQYQGKYAILGPNGSGKSTLMRILSGHLTPSKGKIHFDYQGKKLGSSEIYTQVSYAAPYIELIEELTLKEALVFHSKFKPFIQKMEVADVIKIIHLPKSATHKEIRFFSSGMKQRIKLAMSILSASSLLLLDEPTTNLDKQGMEWYNSLVMEYALDKTIIVASNEERDYTFCKESLNILDFKAKK